jgi:hypothetical protein
MKVCVIQCGMQFAVHQRCTNVIFDAARPLFARQRYLKSNLRIFSFATFKIIFHLCTESLFGKVAHGKTVCIRQKMQNSFSLTISCSLVCFQNKQEKHISKHSPFKCVMMRDPNPRTCRSVVTAQNVISTNCCAYNNNK